MIEFDKSFQDIYPTELELTKALFAKSSVILTHCRVISRHFWVKLNKKCPFLKIPDAALKF